MNQLIKPHQAGTRVSLSFSARAPALGVNANDRSVKAIVNGLAFWKLLMNRRL